MGSSNWDAHLLGKSHACAVRKHKRRGEQFERPWTCHVCNLTMDSAYQHTHLFGRRHARGVRKREAKKAQQLKKLLQNSTHSKQVGGT